MRLNPKYFLGGAAVANILGLVDAVYLTYKHYTDAIPPCSLTNGCETVLTSKFSSFLSVPLAVWGLVFYLAMFFLLMVAFDRKSTSLLKLYILGALAGFALSLVLVYLQIFVIHALCMYCLTSEVLMTLMLVFSLLAGKLLKQNPQTDVQTGATP